jgi:hypothetical protein
MASKKPRAAKPKPAPPPPPKQTWWEKLTTRVSMFGVQEWAGVGVFCGVVAILLVLYLT